MKYLLFILLSTLALTACGSDVISQITTTKIEQSAADKIEQSDAILEKIKRIESKKAQYHQFVELGLLEEGVEAAAVAYRNDSATDGQTTIDIEAVLPNPIDYTYEAWLISPNIKDPLKIGTLDSTFPDDYVLLFESDENLNQYHTVLISKEKELDNEPEIRVLIGQFPDTKSTPNQTAPAE